MSRSAPRQPTARSPRRAAIVYVALLRGINVGGRNLVSMKALKASFERLGFADVATYINSGNVIFRSTATDRRTLERRIDLMLSREHGLPIKTVIRSAADMARLVDTIDESWRIDSRWRYNVIFLRHTIDSAGVLAGIELKPDIEQVVYCPGTLLWSAQLSALTRTAMLKISTRPIYRDMTVRSVRTTRTILALMQRMKQE